MTRDEALDVVSMISSHWPGNQWSTASLDAYARAIEGWDPDLTMRAVTRAVQEMEFYPKVAVLKDFYAPQDDKVIFVRALPYRNASPTKCLR